MTSQLIFPDNPTSQDIFRARIFEEPLVPVGGEPAIEENASFAAVLANYSACSDPDDFSDLTGFLDAHPRSAWSMALLTNLGIVYYGLGYYSRAMEAWAKARHLAISVTDPAAKPLADRALGEFASVLARLGRMVELSELLEAVQSRTFCGPAAEKIAGARGGLANMRAYPERSFRCGPLALHRIMLAAHPDDPKTELVDASESTQRGCSLYQVAELSDLLGLDYQMAFRHRGADFVMPSVVHFTADHFAAVLRSEGDRYLLEDPTFTNEAWVTIRALEDEASGYFLVPPGQLLEGWRTVERAEAEEVWGRGNVPLPPGPPGGCDPTTDPCNPCRQGMAVARIHLLNASLNISDEPVGYSPPVGPDMRFMVRYNQRDDQRISNFNYSHLGRQWTFDWLAFILDRPSNPLAPVTYYMMGGGNRTFTGFDQATQSYAFQPLDQTKLIRTSPSSYMMISGDGTRKVFGQSDGGTDTQRCFLTELIDPVGNSVKLTYDTGMRIVAITDAIGHRTTLEYGNAADSFAITRVNDPFGRSASFGYNAANQLTSITDVIGLVSKFDYDSSTTDFITTLTTPYGITRFTTGANGTTRSLEILYPDGERERVEFNQTVSQSELPAGVPVDMATRNEFLSFRNTYHWDRQGCAFAYGDYTKARIYHWLHSTDLQSPAGILESTKEPLEGRVWYDYGGQTSAQGPIVVGTTSKPTHTGRVLDDGSTQLHYREYNEFGNVTKEIDPAGRTFSYTYADNGIDLLETRQARAGQSALLGKTTYNAQHLPLTSTDAAGQTTSFSYNARGQLTTETNALGHRTTYRYNADGYPTSVEGPLGAADTTTFTYDSFGRVRSVTDNSGYSFTYDYDAADRLIVVTFPDATTQASAYTLLDVTMITDRAGRRTRFDYNAVRQMVKRTDPLGRITRFQWCRCGALRRLADPMGRTTTWRHDIQGRLVCKEYADGSQLSYRYEERTSRLRHRIDETLQVTQYDYNRDDTLSGISYPQAAVPTSPVIFAYDPSYERVTAMTDGDGTTRYHYVPITPQQVLGAGQLAAVERPPPYGTVSYGYDALGRRVSLDIDGTTSSVELDAAGRLTSETNALGTFTYTYDGASSRTLSIMYPNGQTTRLDYGGNPLDNRLLRITHVNGTVPISEFRYGYDLPRGQVTSWSRRFGIDEPSLYSLGYDAASQLTSVAVSQAATPVRTFGYTYDLAGNRLSERVDATTNFSYNALNQLTASDPGDGVATTYRWDAEHRLAVAASGDHEVQLRHNGHGQNVGIRRFAAGIETSSRVFVWAAGQIREERAPDGTVTKRYFRQGLTIETGAAAGHYFYTRDHLGSIRELTDGSGDVRTRYSYDPFGRRTRLAGDLDVDFGFADMLFPTELGLHLTRFRAYDADTGRWLSRDPLPAAERQEGPNLYAYVQADPVNRTDPDGRESDSHELWCRSVAFAVYVFCMTTFKRERRRGEFCSGLANAVYAACLGKPPPEPNACDPEAQCCRGVPDPDPDPGPDPDGGAPPGGL